MVIGSLVIILLAAPCFAVLIALLTRSNKVSSALNWLCSIVCFVTSVLLVIVNATHVGEHILFYQLILVDPLASWVLLCTCTVYALASTYSMGYIGYYQLGKRLPAYYALIAAFAFVMILGAMMNNCIFYWIAIDFTTIVSTFLVCFERSPESTEAAWKYLLIVIAGLSLAVLGFVFFQWAAQAVSSDFTMTWQGLAAVAPLANSRIFLLGFLFVLFGFATKVGLAPMHTWLPDAHSEGPVPASAMLSGALLNTAMLSLVRFVSIMDQTPLGYVAHLMLVILGIISLVIAALFLHQQVIVKRLMAYSSLEHMGIIAIGFGFGGVIGIAGAMYHMLVHSLNKSLMFFGCGNAMQAFNTKAIKDIRGLPHVLPKTGGLWLLGAIAITGCPPGALFLSEFTIMRAGLISSNSWAVYIMIVMLIVIFCSFLRHFFEMYQGEPQHFDAEHAVIDAWRAMPMAIVVIALLVLGLWWPTSFWHFFANTANIIR